MIGNVSDIKELRDTFYFDKTLGYKVLVLDEAQLMTQQAQSALLKVLEESLSGIFFVLCTTHIDKILPTIRSRSLKLRFDLIKEQDIIENLRGICKQKQIEINDNVLKLIADRSTGHLRDAHMLLDQYILLGDEQFNKLVQSSQDLYYKLIIATFRREPETIKRIIEALQCFPMYVLKSDYEQIVLNLIKACLGVEVFNNPLIDGIAKLFKNRPFTLIDILNDKKIYEMFTSDKRFQGAMYLIVSNISQVLK